MKKRIRETGEIVDVISCNKYTSTARNSDLDWVSYIDSKGREHEHEKGLNIYWDFEDVGEELTKEIDWEERRYQISKDMMAAFLSNSCSNVFSALPEKQAKDAVLYADALIAELKKGGEK